MSDKTYKNLLDEIVKPSLPERHTIAVLLFLALAVATVLAALAVAPSSPEDSPPVEPSATTLNGSVPTARWPGVPR